MSIQTTTWNKTLPKIHEEDFFIVQKNSVQKAIPALIVLWACHCGGCPQPASLGNIKSEQSVQYCLVHLYVYLT